MNSPSTIYRGNPQNFLIKPKYSVSLPSQSPQDPLHLARNTPLILSPSTYIPSKNPRNLQIKPKYSVSLPPTAQSAKPTPLSKKHANDFISFYIYSIEKPSKFANQTQIFCLSTTHRTVRKAHST
ncbi:unnamed protein product [Pieris brassicae]|uniref:Uncharacterized protein n=1 Tax=Pieris brassicae TaxID=7116 RepID=A0A9P0TSB1_PIEBR|nr:unnamed protein product [Pieris brassicae]